MIPLLAAALLPFALFVFYLAYVTLIVARKSGRLARTPVPVRILAYAILATAAVLDVLFNLTFGTLLFLQPPREWVFTSRCERHMRAAGWRGRLARWFCEGWLNPFDESHCH